MCFRRDPDDTPPQFRRNQLREVIDELKKLPNDIGWPMSMLLLCAGLFCLLPALIIFLPIYLVVAVIIFVITLRYLPALLEDLKKQEPEATWLDALKQAALIAASWPVLVITGAFAFKYVVK